nr:MAG TPA_asm: hypothetical protein [Bacteriophage sp.]
MESLTKIFCRGGLFANCLKSFVFVPRGTF